MNKKYIIWGVIAIVALLLISFYSNIMVLTMVW